MSIVLEKAIVNKNKNFNYKELTKELQDNLSELQLKIKDKQLPVAVIFEGWGASGKGSFIAEMIKMLDPRFFNVYVTMPATETEKRYPLMKRFWEMTPEKGIISIMDRSWHQELAISKIEDDITSEEYERRIKSVNTFERQLVDDGCLVIKLFLHISKQEQKKRFSKLRDDDDTRWRVTVLDKKRNKNYDVYYKQFDDMLEKTNTNYAPWRVIDTTDKQFTKFQIFNILVSQINSAINMSLDENKIIMDNSFKLVEQPLLKDILLDNKTLQPTKYFDQLKKAQKELAKLHDKIYRRKIPVIIAFEGWDAAGKGGAIKRISTALDPRGYEAIPISAPDKTELNHHYLWRFWRHIPKTGHISIFDRTWYGRVMVEKIEKFTPEYRCNMAYNEINEFEKELTDSGAVIIKFWLQIDKEEQLKRFEERQNNPAKSWKITDEDWRNREKWDQYETAVNDMIRLTSTEFAPWHIIESNNKMFARIKIMNIIIDVLNNEIKQQKSKK